MIIFDFTISTLLEFGIIEFDLFYLIIYFLLMLVFLINTLKIYKSKVKNKLIWFIISLFGLFYIFLFVLGYIPSLKEFITPY